MPSAPNHVGAEAAALLCAGQGDSWTMYYVVRKDRALGFGQAMGLAGAGAVLCAQQWGDTSAWGEAFAVWREHGYCKVALRGDATQFGRLRDELDCALLDTPDDETLLCLPPPEERTRAATEVPAVLHGRATSRRGAGGTAQGRSDALRDPRQGHEEHGQGDGAGRSRGADLLGPARAGASTGVWRLARERSGRHGFARSRR
jgi:hypothetical protein